MRTGAGVERRAGEPRDVQSQPDSLFAQCRSLSFQRGDLAPEQRRYAGVLLYGLLVLEPGLGQVVVRP